MCARRPYIPLLIVGPKGDNMGALLKLPTTDSLTTDPLTHRSRTTYPPTDPLTVIKIV